MKTRKRKKQRNSTGPFPRVTFRIGAGLGRSVCGRGGRGGLLHFGLLGWPLFSALAAVPQGKLRISVASPPCVSELRGGSTSQAPVIRCLTFGTCFRVRACGAGPAVIRTTPKTIPQSVQITGRFQESSTGYPVHDFHRLLLIPTLSEDPAGHAAGFATSPAVPSVPRLGSRSQAPDIRCLT